MPTLLEVVIGLMFIQFKNKIFLAVEWGVVAIMLGIAVIIWLVLNFSLHNFQQFVYLADSFLHGTLAFREIPGSLIDIPMYGGKMYWHLGPFPAVLLMPFVAVWGSAFSQGYIQFFLNILNFFLIYQLSFLLGVKKYIDAFWIAIAFTCGTVYLYIGADSASWRFAQVIALSLVLLSLTEYLKRRRFWLIGLLVGVSIATRANLIFAAPFFVLGIWHQNIDIKAKMRAAAELALPIAVVVFLLMGYNYARFGSVSETGYGFGPYTNARIGFTDAQKIAVEYGNKSVFSLRYVPTNLYYYFLKGPQPVLMDPRSYILTKPFIKVVSLWGNWGNKEFFNGIISSLFLGIIFLADTKKAIVRQSWLTSLLLLGSLLVFNGPQRRYLLDIMPFLCILFIQALPKKQLIFPLKVLIVISFIINFSFAFIW